jgi:hypothetical protein
MNRVSPDKAAQEFMELLEVACSSVDRLWFNLPVADIGGAAGVTAYRERVYCYELYHQLRLLTGPPGGPVDGSPHYTLSGEIDKAGLNAMTLGGKHKPDLVWHVPGDSGHNAVVVEVKTAYRWSRRGVAKDLETLSTFLSAPNRSYRRGVLLVFGRTDQEWLRNRVGRAADAANTDRGALQRAHIWWHPHAGERPKDLGPIT